MRRRWVTALIALGLILSSWFPANAQTTEERLSALESRVQRLERLLAFTGFEIPALVEQAAPAVVSLYVTTNEDEVLSQGTGFIIGTNGLVITNSHVVKPDRALKAKLADGTVLEATILLTDPFIDLAFVSIPGQGYPTLTLADAKATLGEPLVVIGNAYGYSNSVTVGVVSGIDRPDPNHLWHYPSLQTDAAINHGNSGGPILNRAGQVVAMATWSELKDETEGIAFGIPADLIRWAVSRFDPERGIVRPWLGIAVREPYWSQGGLTNDLGLVVGAVHPSGGAARAGLQSGDWILAVGGAPTNYLMELRTQLERHAPGESVPIRITRKVAGRWEEFTLNVLLGEASDRHPGLIPMGYQRLTDDLF